jgi:hypothetical protein
LDDQLQATHLVPSDKEGTPAVVGQVPEDEDEEDNLDSEPKDNGRQSERLGPLPSAPSPPQLPRRLSRPPKPIKHFGVIAQGVTSIPVVAHAFLAGMDHSTDDSEPHGFREAMASPEREKWLTQMKEEVKLLNQMETWQLVKPPPGRKVLTGIWSFKKQQDDKGNIIRYKACWCCRGFLQIPGIDYQETFAGVVSPSTYKAIFAMVAELDYHCEHWDIQTAFLNGPIDTEIYMEQPYGFSHDKGLACLLQRSIYGL